MSRLETSKHQLMDPFTRFPRPRQPDMPTCVGAVLRFEAATTDVTDGTAGPVPARVTI